VKCAYETDSDKKSVKVEARSKNKDGESEYTSDEVDVFCVYVPSQDQVYWFWFDEVGSQFNIFTGNWDELNPANKARVRNPNEYEVWNRDK
jgi:hypothetical protein